MSATRMELSPREREWILQKLATYHPPAAVRAALDSGDWSQLPIEHGTVVRLTCGYCGTPPVLTPPHGRLTLGCVGNCKEREAVETKWGKGGVFTAPMRTADDAPGPVADAWEATGLGLAAMVRDSFTVQRTGEDA